MKPLNRRQKNNNIDGFILLNKPLGESSNYALQTVKKIFAASKAGHTGVLDPLATGVLPILFGQATKFASYLLSASKKYVVSAKLGEETSTGDLEGEVTKTSTPDKLPTKASLLAELKKWTGEIEQVPPMHSALKYKGKPLYEYIRKGIEIERKSRKVTIHNLDLLDFEDSILTLEVECSKGTYIRSLVADIGTALGCYAHVQSLHRTQVDIFSIDNSLSVSDLEQAKETNTLEQQIQPVYELFANMPNLVLTPEDTLAIRYGQKIPANSYNKPAGLAKAFTHEQSFIGLCELKDDILQAKRLMCTHAPST